jgi:hypothetical protein
MTAHSLDLTRIGLIQALTGADRSEAEGKRRIEDAFTLYNNEFTLEVEYALKAYTQGHAAFWTTAGYSDQRAGNLLNSINLGSTIMGALAHWYPPGCPHGRDEALDTLVPLNRRAADDLVMAYAEYGLMRDAEELEMRRLRREARRPKAGRV